MDPFPPLRYVDAAPIEHEGQTYVCLHDPAGYIEEQLVFSGEVSPNSELDKDQCHNSNRERISKTGLKITVHICHAQK